MIDRRRASMVVGLTIALSGLLSPTTPAHAAAISVTTTSDEFGAGAGCSLREAIRAANLDMPFGGCPTGTGADTITLGTGTYTLSIPGMDEEISANGDLDIHSDLTIAGVGPGQTVVDGNGLVTGERVFDVDPPGDADGFTVRLEGLTVQGGLEGGGSEKGGGIRVSDEGALTIEDVLVTKNESSNSGGGIFSEADASLTVVDSTVSSNSADDGAGIAIWDQSTFSLTRAVVTANTIGIPTGEGAGILIWNQSEGSIVDSTVASNTGAENGGGMQIWNDAVVTISGSTVSGNMVTGKGGGLEIENDAQVTITNSTISGNTAEVDGGGIVTYFGQPSIALNNVTVAGNTADSDGNGTGDGGGLAFDVSADPTVTVRNSILANNVDPGGQAPDCGGEPITRQGPNLIESLTGCAYTPGPGDVTGQDPMLGPLADNGGPTQTHALLKGSPAIDAGDPATAAATDQRGLPRNPDIGAYELVLCAKVPVNRIGTAENDTLTGTGGADGFLAQAGNDVVNGLGGNDGACLGDGNDRANGGGGKDTLLGEAGNDRLKGGGGKDRLICGRGTKDTGSGGPGKDQARKCEKGKA